MSDDFDFAEYERQKAAGERSMFSEAMTLAIANLRRQLNLPDRKEDDDG